MAKRKSKSVQPRKPDTKRVKLRFGPPPPFTFNQQEWIVSKTFKKDVELMVPNPLVPVEAPYTSIVKKESPEEGEIQVLRRVAKCNRVVHPIHVSHNPPPPGEKWDTFTMIFENYELGDLSNWREQTFLYKDCKAVPEAHMWRLLVHMTQALAVLQKAVGPENEDTSIVIHRDIKPDNILVLDNGTPYPSFRLHDFGCALANWQPKLTAKSSFCGTYGWQPPENPRINTFAADVWSMAACVHYLAFGEVLFKKKTEDWLDELNARDLTLVGLVQHHYKLDAHLYRARAPRIVTPINQGLQSYARNPYSAKIPRPYKPRYSDRLNYWVLECLKLDPSKRPTVQQLMQQMIPEARVQLMNLVGEKALVDFDLEFY